MLALSPQFVGDLRGMFPSLDVASGAVRCSGFVRPCSEPVGDPLVEGDEVRIGRHSLLGRGRCADRVVVGRAVARLPDHRGSRDLPDPGLAVLLHHAEQPVVQQRLDKLVDDRHAFVCRQVPGMAERVASAEESAEPAARRERRDRATAAGVARPSGEQRRPCLPLARHRPMVDQMLLAASLHLAPLVGVENSDEDAQAAASRLEQRPQDVESSRRAGFGSQPMTPLVGVGGKLFKSRIVEAQHSALFQIRQVDSPAPAQIEIEPVLDDLGESLESHRLGTALRAGREGVGLLVQA